MKTTYILIAYFFAAITSSAAHAQLTWKKITSFPERVSVIYFYDDDLGFIATGTVPGSNVTVSAAIYRTVDGGNSWIRTVTPDGAGFGVNDIIMENSREGWALSDHNAGRVWQTKNGGITWTLVSTPKDDGTHLGNSIRRSSQGILLTDFLSGTIELSQDEGKTFRIMHKANDNILGMDFVDSVHGVAAAQFRNRSLRWLYTTDGGLSWHPSNYGTESWTVRGIKGTSIFIATPEGYSDNDDYLTEVMRSDDYGRTWRKISTLPFRSASDVQISGQALYVQTGPAPCFKCQYPEGYGIYRSLDSGKTWRGLGGPDYWADTRFGIVHDCNGTIIICADKDNNIYKAIDTSVRKIIAFDRADNTVITPAKRVETTICQDAQSTVSVMVSECYRLIITSQELIREDSMCFTLIPKQLPVTIGKEGSSFGAKLTTHDSLRDYSTFIHLKGYYLYGIDSMIAFDTAIRITIGVTDTLAYLQADRESVAFKTTARCRDNERKTALLTNLGCKPIMLTGGPFGVTHPFTVDPIPLPRVLQPGDTVQFHVYFDPDSVNYYMGSVHFTSVSGASIQDLYIPLIGMQLLAPPVLRAHDSLIDMRNVHICPGRKDTTVMIENMGCTPLSIRSVTLKNNKYFSIDSIALPKTLGEGEVYSINVHYDPEIPGFDVDTLFLKAESNAIESTTSITLCGMAKPSQPKLVSSDMSVDFDTISLCSGRMYKTITIRNDGCDRLTILSGPGQLGEHFGSTTLMTPLMIMPGESLKVTVWFDPKTVGTFNEELEYEAERHGLHSILFIELHGTCVYGEGVLVSSSDSIGFQPLTICSQPDTRHGYITNSGCDSIVVTDIAVQSQSQFNVSSREMPFVLAPGDSEQYHITLTPLQKGRASTELTILAHDMHGMQKNMSLHIPITAEVNEGTRLLVQEVNVVNFGARRICDMPDTTISYINRGCDTLTISIATLSGSGFVIDGYQMPVHLAPGEKFEIKAHSLIDTISSNAISSAHLTLISNSDVATPAVGISRMYLYPTTISTSLSLSRPNATSGDTVALEITFIGSVSGVKEFDGYLSYNSDLLSYIGEKSDNAVTFVNGHLSVESKDSLRKTTTLYFRTSLTIASSTLIELTQCRLNRSEPAFSDCIAMISGCSTLFDYESICGDRTLSQYLHSGNITSIRKVSPNPLHGSTVTVTFTTPTESTLRIELIDMNGNVVSSNGGATRYARGEHTVTLPVSSLPSGIYYVRLSDEQGLMQTRKVIEAR